MAFFLVKMEKKYLSSFVKFIRSIHKFRQGKLFFLQNKKIYVYKRSFWANNEKLLTDDQSKVVHHKVVNDIVVAAAVVAVGGIEWNHENNYNNHFKCFIWFNFW